MPSKVSEYFVGQLVSYFPIITKANDDKNIEEVLSIMNAQDISALPLVNHDNQYTGIASLADIVAFLLMGLSGKGKQGAGLLACPIRRVLGCSEESNNILVFDAHDRLDEVIRSFAAHRARRTLIKGHHWEHIMSEIDLAAFLLEHLLAFSELSTVTAGSVGMMDAQQLVVAEPHDTVLAVMKRLAEHRKRCVPIIKKMSSVTHQLNALSVTAETKIEEGENREGWEGGMALGEHKETTTTTTMKMGSKMEVVGTFGFADLRALTSTNFSMLTKPVSEFSVTSKRPIEAVTCLASTPLDTVLHLINQHKVSQVWVVKAGTMQIVGVCALADILSYLVI